LQNWAKTKLKNEVLENVYIEATNVFPLAIVTLQSFNSQQGQGLQNNILMKCNKSKQN
jgi:hypothetical protein